MIGRSGMPRSETRPPFVTASKPCRIATSAPLISRTTSTPTPPVSSRSRATTSSRPLITTSAPSRRAISRRSGLMSVAKTLAAPASLAIATVIRPIGPQPVTTTVCPASSSTNAAWTALPIGSWIAAISGLRPSRRPGVVGRQRDVLGERAVHVDAQDPQVRADVLAAGPALVAGLVDEVGLGGDQGAQRDLAAAAHVRAVGHHPAGHLVAEDPGQAAAQPALAPSRPSDRCGGRCRTGWRPRPGSAARHRRARDRDVAQLGAGRRARLDQRAHRGRDLAVSHAASWARV